MTEAVYYVVFFGRSILTGMEVREAGNRETSNCFPTSYPCLRNDPSFKTPIPCLGKSEKRVLATVSLWMTSPNRSDKEEFKPGLGNQVHFGLNPISATNCINLVKSQTF